MASVAGRWVMDVGQSPELGEQPQAGLVSPGCRIHPGGERGGWQGALEVAVSGI